MSSPSVCSEGEIVRTGLYGKGWKKRLLPDQTRDREFTTSRTTPPAIDAIPTIGENGMYSCFSLVACTGPISSTFSRLVYRNPPTVSATTPNTTSRIPMSFTVPPHDAVMHVVRQNAL